MKEKNTRSIIKAMEMEIRLLELLIKLEKLKLK
jgi:hypothetical protein